MLTIVIDPSEASDIWDDERQQFVHKDEFKGCTLILEHSLISISKWEAKWHVPFLSSKKTEEQTLDYIRCMTVNQCVPANVCEHLSLKNVQDISEYINDPMTATTVNGLNSNNHSREIVTSELIYYWMIALQIPFECEKWHLNRLLQLIAVCNVKNTPGKKMSKNDIIARNKALNEARKKKYNTKG